ncbi:MAG: polysaccharide deacetylase family protein [Nitrospirae bacterium]|nr:polysaccharide deacetylase family protein [Nitrospirota bacterium]
MRPVPVLMYHHVNPHKGDMITISPEIFDGQMRYLAESGYRTLTLDELASYITGELILEQKAVAITFDDGWLDNYLFAWPVIEKYGIKAAVFVVTDWVEKASEGKSSIPEAVPTHSESKDLVAGGLCSQVILNWEIIAKMAGSGLVNFYSHSRSHPECDSLSPAALTDELAGSRSVIEERLKRPCPYLCWPKGKYSNLAVSAARDAGYKTLFTTKAGVVTAGSDPLAISRIVVKDSIPWFKKRLNIYTGPLLSKLYLLIKKK